MCNFPKICLFWYKTERLVQGVWGGIYWITTALLPDFKRFSNKALILNILTFKFALKLFSMKYFVPILKNFEYYWKKSRGFFPKLTYHRPSEMVPQSNFSINNVFIVQFAKLYLISKDFQNALIDRCWRDSA